MITTVYTSFMIYIYIYIHIFIYIYIHMYTHELYMIYARYIMYDWSNYIYIYIPIYIYIYIHTYVFWRGWFIHQLICRGPTFAQYSQFAQMGFWGYLFGYVLDRARWSIGFRATSVFDKAVQGLIRIYLVQRMTPLKPIYMKRSKDI